MEKALEKRPVPREQIDEAVSRIVHKVRSLGDREVSSRAIGELVMEELRHLDEVAYVRFASVYRQFEDVEAFHEEIQRLRSARRRAARRGQRARRASAPRPRREPRSAAAAAGGPRGQRRDPDRTARMSGAAGSAGARRCSPTSTASPCSAH